MRGNITKDNSVVAFYFLRLEEKNTERTDGSVGHILEVGEIFNLAWLDAGVPANDLLTVVPCTCWIWGLHSEGACKCTDKFSQEEPPPSWAALTRQ